MRYTEDPADFFLCPARQPELEYLSDIGWILGRHLGSRQSKLMLSGIYGRFFSTELFSNLRGCIASERKIPLKFQILRGGPLSSPVSVCLLANHLLLFSPMHGDVHSVLDAFAIRVPFRVNGLPRFSFGHTGAEGNFNPVILFIGSGRTAPGLPA